MKRETRIVVERERNVRVVDAGSSADYWWVSCAASTPMLTLEMAGRWRVSGTAPFVTGWTTPSFTTSDGRRTFRTCDRSFLDHLKRLNFLPRKGSRRKSFNLIVAEDR